MAFGLRRYWSLVRAPVQHRALVVCVVVALGVVVFFLWPQGVPLSAEQTSASQPPVSERDDTYLVGRMFQQIDGQWHQCKTRIARAMFF